MMHVLQPARYTSHDAAMLGAECACGERELFVIESAVTEQTEWALRCGRCGQIVRRYNLWMPEPEAC